MKKVLFIDDDSQILKMIQRKLEKTDIKGFYTTDGKKGLRLVESEDIDLVFTDLMMPNLNGLSVLRQIHQIKEHTLVVVVSANAQSSTITRTLNTNMVYKYIVKPWKIDNEAINFIYECLDIAEERKHKEMLKTLSKSLNMDMKETSLDKGLDEIFVNIKILKRIEKMSNWILISENKKVIEASKDISLNQIDIDQEALEVFESNIGDLRLYGNFK